MPPYDGLLLDHDGVLVTHGDRDALDRAVRRACWNAGITDVSAESVDALGPGTEKPAVLRTAQRHGIDPDNLWRYREDAVAAGLKDEVQAGRKKPYDDVSLLKSIERPIGIVSNNQSRVIEYILDQFELVEAIDTVHARAPRLDSLDEKKPAPTYLRGAIDELELTNPLFVGDSRSDILAGRHAGVDTCFLRRPHRRNTDISVEPTYEGDCFNDVIDLLEQ